uniref:dynein heavy chain domain-containing protein 1-like isoform X2 n=1 Tax=Panthera onca TaxID=9690 RepID=UPI0029541D62|nr:dynein heavy chain domain-containing protein 1-like isoform X2 [Panthera onca]
MQQGLQERLKNCKRIRTDQLSVYLQKEQGQQLEQKLRQTEAWLLRLGQLARLVDHMIGQNLVSIIEEEITSFVANILQAPRQNPFLSAELVFDDCGQLSHEPCIENMIQILTGGLQSVKASALKVFWTGQGGWLQEFPILIPCVIRSSQPGLNLVPCFLFLPPSTCLGVKVMQSTDLKTPWDSLISEGLVWPWKSHTVSEALEVHGCRLRGQYLPPNYKQLQEDLDNSPRIQQALTLQQALLEGMLWEVKEFCKEHHWMTGIHKFLQAWGPQKLESMRGCPIKNYMMLVSRVNMWQTDVSNIPKKLITKGRLLQLNCYHIQAEMGECCLSSFLSFHLPYLIRMALLGPGNVLSRTFGEGPSLDL